MSRKKVRVKCIQTRLFDDDEIKIKSKSSKPKKYSPYIKGAVDMFLKFLKSQNEANTIYNDTIMNIIHLPRPYMEAFVRKAVKDKEFLYKFLITRSKPKFSVVRDEFGDIKNINVRL